MRGEVEIWRGGKLLHKEPNMLVDGAGELLAEIMTVSPSLSGVADHATSSILDASNYTIQAISFGAGSYPFNKASRNAQQLTADKIQALYELDYDIYGAEVAVLWDSATVGYSFTPEVGLPEWDNPASKVLAENTSVSASFAGSGVSSSVSSIFPGNGQHVNFLPSAIGSAMMENTEFSALDAEPFGPSSLRIAQSVLGAFPVGSGTDMQYATLLTLRYPWDTYNKAKSRVYGHFNEVSSMDVSGFVNMVMSGSPHTTTNYLMSSTASGLVLSGGCDTANSGMVEYSVSFASGDLATVNMYGGIYQLGLWTIDMKQSLLNGNTPPFAFSILNNPRKYKLFARKGFSKNLCYINDNGVNKGIDNYKPLTIKWRLHFI